MKGCGEKLRDPSPSTVDESRPALKSRVESPDANVSISTTSGFSFRNIPLSISQNIRSGTQIKMETPESPSVYYGSPSPPPSKLPPSPRLGVTLRSPPPNIPPSSVASIVPTFVRPQPVGDEATFSESLYSQTPKSDGSSVTTETSFDERKSRMIESIVRDATNRIKVMFLQARGSSGSTSNPPGQDPTPGLQESRPHTTHPTTGNDRNLKRKMDDRGYCGTDDEDEDTGNHGPKDPAATKEEAPRYACPYFKYNPSFYKSARGCPGPGWLDVHRVK